MGLLFHQLLLLVFDLLGNAGHHLLGQSVFLDQFSLCVALRTKRRLSIDAFLGGHHRFPHLFLELGLDQVGFLGSLERFLSLSTSDFSVFLYLQLVLSSDSRTAHQWLLCWHLRLACRAFLGDRLKQTLGKLLLLLIIDERAT